MSRSGIPPVTKLYLALLIICSLLTFVLRYSTYIHLVTSEEHAEDHQHLMNDQSGTEELTNSVDDIIPNPHEIYVPLVALVTGDSLFSKPWTLFTSAFVEDGVVSFLTTFTLILYTGRYIEVLWGSREFFKYLTFSVILSNFLVFTVLSLRFSALGNEDANDIAITGSTSIVIALLVAIKQRIPNHYLLFLNGFIRLRVSLVPFAMLATFNIISIFYPYYTVTNLLSWSGLFISWIYLRFCKEGGSGRQLSLLPETNAVNVSLTKGDRTNQFAFKTFFPTPLSILVGFLSEKVFSIFVSLKLLNKQDFFDNSEEIDQEINNEVLTVSNTTQNDLISSMTQSRIFTSSSLAGVSGDIPFFALPKEGLLSKVYNKFFSKDSNNQSLSELESQKQLDRRRKLALMQLDSKISD